MTNRMSLGIDLGTTYSAAAVCQGSSDPICMKFPGDGSQVPSAVYLEENGPPLVGSRARRAAIKNPARFYSLAKKLMTTAPDAPMGDDGPTPVEFSAIILRHIFQVVCQNCPRVVQALASGQLHIAVTHPADYRSKDQQAIMRAAQLVGDGFAINQFYSEPEAGAVSLRRHHGHRIHEGDYIVPIDTGGGTTDITVLQYNNGACDELVTDRGDGRLGGVNFTGPVFQHVCEQLGYGELAACYNPDRGLSLHDPALDDTQRRLAAAMWDKADELKVLLSSSDAAETYLETPHGLLEVALSRDQFMSLNAESYDRFDAAVAGTLQGTGLDWCDIPHVIMIGGSSQLPGLRERVGTLTDRSPDDVFLDSNSENVVASGAAFMGYAGERAAQVLTGGCGVRVRQGNAGETSDIRYKMFFPPGAVIPAAGRTVEDLGQFIDAPGGQVSIALELCEAEPGVQVPPPNGSLPLLSPEQVVTVHSAKVQCELPPGRYETQLGFDYTNRMLRYRLHIPALPEIEVLSGVVNAAPDEQSAPSAGPGSDIAILLDCSSSMRGDRLQQAKQAALHLLDQLDDNDVRISLIAFGGEASVLCSLTNDLGAVRAAVAQMDARGNTPMDGALELATRELDDAAGRERLVVLLSDGYPNDSGDTVAQAERLKDAGVRIVAVGVGQSAAEQLLQYNIASTPQNYYHADRPEELVDIFETIAHLYIA